MRARLPALTADSREVRPGFVFSPFRAAKADGLALPSPQSPQGAAAVVANAVVAERSRSCAQMSPFIRVADVRAALALAAARFYPRQPATIIAVTGTSGKTSVAAFVRQIWERLGHGRRGARHDRRRDAGGPHLRFAHDARSGHPAPDARPTGGEGVTHLAMEASSHGLDQHRLDGVRLAAGAFTNLSRDHLDYHPTLAAYLAAKLRLFERLLRPGQPAVVDADSDVAGEGHRRVRARAGSTC